MSDDAPRRGRPRSADADRAILDATAELLGEAGINGLSMDRVACRAGVAKATIYRRWSSKEALVIDALSTAIPPIEVDDTGGLRSDLEEYFRELVGRKRASTSRDILPHLIEAACHDENLEASLDDYVESRRAPLRAILERGVERGELDAGCDVEHLIDALIGPFLYRRLLFREPVGQDYVDRILSIVLPSCTP